MLYIAGRGIYDFVRGFRKHNAALYAPINESRQVGGCSYCRTAFERARANGWVPPRDSLKVRGHRLYLQLLSYMAYSPDRERAVQQALRQVTARDGLATDPPDIAKQS